MAVMFNYNTLNGNLVSEEERKNGFITQIKDVKELAAKKNKKKSRVVRLGICVTGQL